MSKTTHNVSALESMRRALHGQIISVEFFKRHWLGVLCIVVLLLMYISTKYICQTRIEKIDKLNRELEVVKTERVRVRSEYMGRTSESAMQHMVDSLHLGIESRERPPYLLEPSTSTKTVK